MASFGSSMTATTSYNSRFPDPGPTSFQSIDRSYNQAFSEPPSRFPLPVNQEPGSSQLQSTDRVYNQASSDVTNSTPLSMVPSAYPLAVQHPALSNPSSLPGYPPSLPNSASFLSAEQLSAPALPFGGSGTQIFPEQGVPLTDAGLSQARGDGYTTESSRPSDTQCRSTASSTTPSQCWSSTTDNPSTSSSQPSARTGSAAGSWSSRPHTADDTFQYTDSSSSTASLTGELMGELQPVRLLSPH